MFVWKNTTLLQAFEEHQPAIHATLTSVPLARIDEAYPNAPRETIDVGIMEKARNVATIPASFGVERRRQLGRAVGARRARCGWQRGEWRRPRAAGR